MTGSPLTARPRPDSAAAGRSLARVTGTEALGSLVWLTLKVPGWPGARPGQFALLQARDSFCFLGRALSVSQEEGQSVSFLIAPVGQGTRELCRLREDEELWVLGPLGNGFDAEALDAGGGRLVVVGGGVGAAPFPLLLARLGGGEVLVLLGFRDRAQAAGARPVAEAVATLQHRGPACRLEVVTEDGSLGRAEKVTDSLRRELHAGDRLAVCGPPAMTQAVGRMCMQVSDTQAWFCLESGMACGVGSCHGCVVPLVDGTMVRVCREGPVFAGEALFAAEVGPGAEVG